MSDPVLALVMLGLLVFTIMIGFPVAFTMMALGVGFGYYAYYLPDQGFFDNRVFALLTQNTYGVMTNAVLPAVPLFLLMGYMVERANILERLFYSLQVAAKRLPGALAIAAITTCALFATASGIVGAVVTLMGLLAYPQMLRAGYDIRLSSGAICAGGCLGIMIPPSILLIVYGAQAGVSVVQLYAAALLPGFLLAGLYLIYVVSLCSFKPHLAPTLPKEQTDLPFLRVMLLLVTSFFPLAVLILAVLGSIMFGLATPTEAAAMGATGSIVLAASYRALTWQRLKEAVYLTARTSAMVCWLFVGSFTFAAIFAYLGGEGIIERFVLGLELSPVTFMIVAQIIIFFLGWPLEWTEIIIIFVPIFLPLLPHFDVDPLMFGILVALNLQTAFLSPPMAMAAYYLKGIAPPHVLLTQIFAGCVPFLLLVIVAMVVVYVFPPIVTWLPNLLYHI